MATFAQIPFQAGQGQVVNVSLGGTTYQLRMIWNVGNQSWALDIYDSTGATPIIQGIALVSNVDLLAQYAYLGLGGKLVAVTLLPNPDDYTGFGLLPIDFNDLGITGFVYFVTP